MTYQILRLLHIIGAVLIGAGLIGVWLSDLRSRQVGDLPRFGEAVRNVRVFYDGLVLPGALLLLASGTWLIVTVYGGWSYHFLKIPWLAGMVVLFAFEFIEGNTITRRYFLRLRRLTVEAEATGRVSPALEHARPKRSPRSRTSWTCRSFWSSSHSGPRAPTPGPCSSPGPWWRSRSPLP